MTAILGAVLFSNGGGWCFTQGLFSREGGVSLRWCHAGHVLGSLIQEYDCTAFDSSFQDLPWSDRNMQCLSAQKTLESESC